MTNPYANLQAPNKAKRPATAVKPSARRTKSIPMAQSPDIQSALGTYRFHDQDAIALTQSQTRPQTSLQQPSNRLSGSTTLSQLRQEIDDAQQANYYKNLSFSEVDFQKVIRFGSKMDSVEEIAKLMRQQVFDHAKFNVFLDSVFGRTLLQGLLEADPKGRVSSFIRDTKTYPKAMRNAQLETMSHRRDRLNFNQGKRNLPSTTKLTKQIEQCISSAENDTSAQVLACKFKDQLGAPEKSHMHSELVRVKARVKEEMRRHSQIVSSSRVNTNNLNIEQLIRLLEFNPVDLSLDAEVEEKRRQQMMNAMLFLFRIIDVEDWKDTKMANLQEKLDILSKLKKEDFKAFYDVTTDVKKIKVEQRFLEQQEKQNRNKSHLQILIEKKHEQQDSPLKRINTHNKKSSSTKKTNSPLQRLKTEQIGKSTTTEQISTTQYSQSISRSKSPDPGFHSSLTNYNGRQSREFNILEDDDEVMVSSAYQTPRKNEFVKIPLFYSSSKTQQVQKSKSEEGDVYETTASKSKFRQNIQTNRLRSAQKMSIIPELKRQKKKRVSAAASDHQSDSSQMVRRKAISQRAKIASDYIVSNCDHAVRKDQHFDKLIEGCQQVWEYQSRLKDALVAVTDKNQAIEQKDQLVDIQGQIRAFNYEESMNYSHFFCPYETNQFKEQNRKVTHYLTHMAKHQRQEIWKPSKFEIGRFTAVGKLLNQA